MQLAYSHAIQFALHLCLVFLIHLHFIFRNDYTARLVCRVTWRAETYKDDQELDVHCECHNSIMLQMT